ncbi:SDR family NAD(P)-dependent oxidoreductase [Lapillicoccus jejuensis]|uniref:NAD(P)-dependent dehydrogenase (Short-subunit alcohol dehydrogenase family) n=1 Tax=Lapillicoccus jejuensis TaxID=402171 RepID=A0A542DXL7_9MICO|nr:SDR family NAD(P)-dependent oxidoreductase [Lapillicoccus jejuensis]TQJ07830.1 NAD(P)-dependent dehydrogenase (short-subunit alcohol dehydrogenase family) [Lapillicoccus jejuensis]
MPLSLDLSGRVVLVVGAGSSGAGLSNGEAAALAYADAGAAVVALDRDPDEAQRVADEVVARGGESLAVTADVTDETQVERAVAEAVAAYGAPSVLHHNVGAVRQGSVTDLDLAGWEAAFRLNVTSAYLTTRHVLPHLLAAGRGVVTTVSSVAAIRSTGYVYPAYSASKAALDQLTVSLALTYADRGIRANAILPGLIDTPLVTAQLAHDPAALRARHAASPTGRMGSPWDVARVAVFLASHAASYVNGVCLPVDGGLSARCL